MQDKDKPVYISERGATFDIRPNNSGLFIVVQTSGGKPAKICEQQFTGQMQARKELVKYLESRNNLGYAEYPGATVRKPKSAKSEGE